MDGRACLSLLDRSGPGGPMDGAFEGRRDVRLLRLVRGRAAAAQ